MSDSKSRPSVFAKMTEAIHTIIDAQLLKARSSIINSDFGDDFLYSKAITEDPSFAIHAAGWKEKPHRLQDGHLKQMSVKNSIIAAIIQTRQNQVGGFAKLVDSEQERGWRIRLRDREKLLEAIKEELKENKSKLPDNPNPEPTTAPENSEEPSVTESQKNSNDDTVEEFNWELERRAQEILESKFKEARTAVEKWVSKCGREEDRPFETEKWNFEATLRAIVRDSLTFDRYAVEIVPDRGGKPHHWFPVDGATIKFASDHLKNYKAVAENFTNLNILYPDKKAQSIEQNKTIELKDDLLEKEAYKYVQVVRGKIERAFTPDELKVGIRNPTTDIYNNGYGISELELVVSLVTGHLNAEFYNQAYFTQGFSAKGILHIKAPLNRRKLATVRQQWQHAVRGARNSFQTPIFAGLEDVEWIPLTQKHEDIGFEGWMRYLVKMICAVYQIDPQEIGIDLREEAKGSGLSGENTREKLEHSKDKGLYPLIKHFENFINEHIIKPFDDRFVLEFTGISGETPEATLKRQEAEGKFKKTVNEIRAEDGLPPLPGMDDFILNPQYADWYDKYSKKGQERMQKEQMNAQGTQGNSPQTGDANEASNEPPSSNEPEQSSPEDEFDSFFGDFDLEEVGKSAKKRPQKVRIDYYKLEK